MLRRLADSGFVRKTYSLCRRVPLVGNILHSRVSSILPRGRRVWTSVARGPGKDLWILIDPRFDYDFSSGKHESWIQELLVTELGEGDCFYDVGAHIGFFSLIAARITGPTGYVYSFEPDPQNVSLLRANAARNQMQHIAVVDKAVWQSSGALTFERSNEASSGMEGHVVDEEKPKGETVSVSAISLDDFLFSGKGQPPNLIKIDVEGGEFLVLAGARRLLSELKPRILCEIHTSEMTRRLENFLDDFGYTSIHTPAKAKSYLWAIPT